jgi:hypothetical protein
MLHNQGHQLVSTVDGGIRQLEGTVVALKGARLHKEANVSFDQQESL